MIIVVDDEAENLRMARTSLEAAGYEVETFDTARAALVRIEEREPELILSDIRMPEMGGFELRRECARRFPTRSTPFVFFSSLADPSQIVEGLDTGVDDYLVKPIAPVLLQAKVRSILKNRRRESTPIFRGDLARYPFVKVLQFCELNGLTGRVEFASDDHSSVVPFQGGNIAMESLADADDCLASLYDLRAGTFTIHSRPVDFSSLSDVALAAATQPAGTSAAERPMGRLSGVRLGERLFQLQTEMVSLPRPQLLTIVILDGNTVLKKASGVEPGASRSVLEKAIEEQHAAVEAEVRERLEVLLKAKGEGPASRKAQFARLFEAGFESYRSGDFAAARDAWIQARTIDPNDRTLEINLAVVERKLGRASEGASGPNAG